MAQMKKLIIRSSEWLRAEGRTLFVSGLCVGDRFCCLGLDALSEGFKPYELEGFTMPSSLLDSLAHNNPEPIEEKPYFRRWAIWHEDDGESSAYAVDGMDAATCQHINDDPKTTDEEKIALLTPIFARHGIEIDWRPNE